MSAEEIPSIVASVVWAAAWDDLELAVVFGSAASGRVRPGSDVDVLILRTDRAEDMRS